MDGLLCRFCLRRGLLDCTYRLCCSGRLCGAGLLDALPVDDTSFGAATAAGRSCGCVSVLCTGLTGRSCCGGAGCFAAVRCPSSCTGFAAGAATAGLACMDDCSACFIFFLSKYHSCEKPGLPSGAHCFLSPVRTVRRCTIRICCLPRHIRFGLSGYLPRCAKQINRRGIRSAVLCISRNGFIRIALCMGYPTRRNLLCRCFR